MKYAPKKVFILDNGSYTELSYEEFCSLKENDISYADKFFIPLHGMLLEVTEETYRDFYKAGAVRNILMNVQQKTAIFLTICSQQMILTVRTF